MYTKKQLEYLDSVDGKAHQSAIEIIGDLERLNLKMHSCVAGYLDGESWEHWVEYNKDEFKI
jgi:hypothetical protein